MESGLNSIHNEINLSGHEHSNWTHDSHSYASLGSLLVWLLFMYEAF